jgi:hypothetical protein
MEGHLRPQVSWNHQLPVVCQNYLLSIRRFAGATSPRGGMPELLAPEEAPSTGSEGRFLTTGTSLSPVVF